ncbi:MAG: type III-A CRISPR-associated protein Cas10/Csm1 [Candidatus Cloacimonadaceae bacterium]
MSKKLNGIKMPSHSWERIHKYARLKTDRTASGWDREVSEESGGRQQYKKVPLYSGFGKVRLDKKEKPKDDNLWTLPLRKLTPENSFPVSQSENSDKSAQYKQLWHDFNKAVHKLAGAYNSGKVNLEQFNAALENLLQEYFWCVPANTMEKQPANSLYHHLANTATIAAVLYLTHAGEENPSVSLNEEADKKSFLMVGLDLSGIQDYIYDLDKEKSAKAAKFLRARSFQVRICLEMAIEWLCRELDLPKQCVLFQAAGKAFLLLPDKPQIREGLNKIKKELDAEMLKRYLGSLTILLASIPVSLTDLDKHHFRATMQECLEKIGLEKRRKYSSVFCTDKWHPEAFLLQEGTDIHSNTCCSFCHRRKTEQTDEEGSLICSRCLEDENLGKTLVKENLFKLTYNASGESLLELGPIKLQTVYDNGKNELQPDATYFSIHKRISDFIPYNAYAVAVPHDKNGNILDFGQIAEKAEGIAANAVLKGDVDNLGLIFQYGIYQAVDQDQYELSVTTYNTISAQLDYFFAVYLPYLVQQKYADSIYIVYAGGDDFCLVGAWNKVIDLARELKNEFTRYTAQNQDLHFSAAIELMHAKTPVRFAILKADEKLAAAKKTASAEDTSQKALLRKNRLNLFELSVNWDGMDKLMKYAGKLDNWLQNNQKTRVTTQFLYRLLAYNEMYLKTLEPKCELRNYLYDALLNYDIKRNIKQAKDAVTKEGNIADSLRQLTAVSSEVNFKDIRIPIFYVLYKNRKRQGGNNAG